MSRREGTDDSQLTAALDAYRAAARAEADAHFDERALDAQRSRILDRLVHLGQPARVLRFPGAGSGHYAASPVSRRWISVAAAAGLLVGILTGQLLHIMPGDAWVHRPVPRASSPEAASGLAIVPASVSTPADDENALLDAIDLAVQSTGAPDLRAFEDLTFAYEPR
jgi:hypothetical protein